MEPAAAARLAELLGTPIAAVRDLGGQHGVRHYRLRLADGRLAFPKNGNGLDSADAAGTGLAAEAAGLRWLAAARSVPVPSVLLETADYLVIDWIDEGQPSRESAVRFGRELAGLHGAGADRFGSPRPGVIAGLPLPSGAAPGECWPDWYAANRVLPYARMAARLPLHQLHPLLVHVCLFGAAYREAALGACRAVLAA